MPNNEYNPKENRREDWETPDWLFNHLHKIFDFFIDLAANKDNAKLVRFITEEIDFFRVLKTYRESKDEYFKRWKWCNPPYKSHSKGAKDWVESLLSLDGIVVLLPASVGAKWFSSVWGKSSAILFLNKRLKYKGAPDTAQFDNCLAIRGNLTKEMCDSLSGLGTLVLRGGIYTKPVRKPVRKPV